MSRLFQAFIGIVIIASICAWLVSDFNDTGSKVRTKAEQQETKNTVPALP